jgi:hypothetical protein
MNVTTGRVEPMWIGSGTFTLVRNSVWAAASGRHLAFWDVDSFQAAGAEVDAAGGESDPHGAAAIAVRTSDIVFGFGSPPGYVLVDLATKKAGDVRTLPLCR